MAAPLTAVVLDLWSLLAIIRQKYLQCKRYCLFLHSAL